MDEGSEGERGGGEDHPCRGVSGGGSSALAGSVPSLAVTARTAASGWMNLRVPTTAMIMGGLSLTGVGYDRSLRFVWPLLAVLAALVCGFVAAGAWEREWATAARTGRVVPRGRPIRFSLPGVGTPEG